MSIKTIDAHMSCADIGVSAPWYEKLFGKPPVRRPMPGLVEWQFSDSAEVQLYEDRKHADTSTLTLGVLPSNRSGNDSRKPGSIPDRSKQAKAISSCASSIRTRT
jgi:hypothetical protein